jgi:hypothetical protein
MLACPRPISAHEHGFGLGLRIAQEIQTSISPLQEQRKHLHTHHAYQGNGLSSPLFRINQWLMQAAIIVRPSRSTRVLPVLGKEPQ